jgi:hypothetical protein
MSERELNHGGVIPPDKPKIFFISLCRGLVGYYVKVIAYDEATVRRHAAEYFGRLWCSVYSEAYLYEILRKRFPDNTKIVNNNKPIDLTNGWEWE